MLFNTHTHTHTHTHTQLHTQSQLQIHTHTNTHTHTVAGTHAHTHIAIHPPSRPPAPGSAAPRRPPPPAPAARWGCCAPPASWSAARRRRGPAGRQREGGGQGAGGRQGREGSVCGGLGGAGAAGAEGRRGGEAGRRDYYGPRQRIVVLRKGFIGGGDWGKGIFLDKYVSHMPHLGLCRHARVVAVEHLRDERLPDAHPRVDEPVVQLCGAGVGGSGVVGRGMWAGAECSAECEGQGSKEWEKPSGQGIHYPFCGNGLGKLQAPTASLVQAAPPCRTPNSTPPPNHPQAYCIGFGLVWAGMSTHTHTHTHTPPPTCSRSSPVCAHNTSFSSSLG